MTDMTFQVKALIAACRSLCAEALDLSSSADPALELQAQLHSAQRCVELAHLSLQGGEVAALSAPVVRTSMVASVADHLLSSIPGEAAPGDALAPLGAHANNQASFSGSTAAIAIPDLLGFLQLQGKTGELHLKLESENILLEFLGGELVHASSDNSPIGNRLGEILVEHGAIDKQRLGAFMVDCRSDTGKLGKALETEQLVSDNHLRLALEVQIQQTFHRMFSAGPASFEFHSRDSAELEGELRLNVIQLLLESARASDDELESERGE